MIIIVSVLVGLATVAVLARVFARFKLGVRLQIDDYLCFGALFWLFGMYIELVLCKYKMRRWWKRSRRWQDMALEDETDCDN